MLNVICAGSNDALLGWAAKCEREGKSWKRERQRAAAIGTACHDAIEHYPEPLGPRPLWTTDEEWERIQRNYEDFKAWCISVRPRILAKEVHLVSERHQAGGTPDAISEFPGHPGRVIVDYKTGKTLDLPKVSAQLAFYADAALENGLVKEPIRRGLVLHFTPAGLRPYELGPEHLDAGLLLWRCARQVYRTFKEFPKS